jgi:hypothetical protein
MNSINRNNYETFFLLYIDHELSNAEKKAVDEFVQANPDLQEELFLLQQSILSIENIVFEDKASLLKAAVDFTEIQEKLLLYLDNELLPAEQIELDGLIQANPVIEKEWNLLQRTKLSADNPIAFEDKQSLYRKENGRVVSFPWKRLLAAAVLIGFGVWGGLKYFNNNNKIVEGNIARKIQELPDLNGPKIAPRQATQAITAMLSAGTNEKGKSESPLRTKQATAKVDLQPIEKITPSPLTEKDIQSIVLNEQTNNLPIPNLDNVNSIGSNKTITANVTPEQQVNTIVIPGNKAITEKTARQDAAANVYAVSFNDNKEETDNHVLFMDEEKIRKSKFGGVLRKVKRVIERNTNINTGGNVIKVANLEFAIQ